MCNCSASMPSLIMAVPWLLHPLPQLLTVAPIPCCSHRQAWTGIHNNESGFIHSLDDAMSHYIVGEYEYIMKIPNP